MKSSAISVTNILAVFFLLVVVNVSAHSDLTAIQLVVTPDFRTKSITVKSTHNYSVSVNDSSLKFLLHPQFDITAVSSTNRKIEWKRLPDGIQVTFNPGKPTVTIQIDYEGQPKEAIKPPWEGGFIWKTDNNGKPWLAVTCEEYGAQLWWPAPERYNDEPASTKVTCIYPSDLFFKGNGKLVSDSKDEVLRTTTWEVTYPINVYNITINVGDYTHIEDSLERVDGTVLKLDYYPLIYNKDKAIKQFSQVKPMLTCYEKAFGNYPFERDGFSIVETPYDGMEHQGAIAYGNGYINGYRGVDYSAIGLPFDFILIHETAHEWFGNSVTGASPSDFWLQEAFCTYAEMAYVECLFGYEKALAYINAKKRLAQNKIAILSDSTHSIDMYAKGALMIHTLSQFSPSQDAWKKTMRSFVTDFYCKSIGTAELITWFCKHLPGLKPPFFYQYLNHPDIPVLEYAVVADKNKWKVRYRINNADPGFVLPLTWLGSDKPGRKDANGDWKEFYSDDAQVKPDETLSYFKPLRQ